MRRGAGLPVMGRGFAFPSYGWFLRTIEEAASSARPGGGGAPRGAVVRDRRRRPRLRRAASLTRPSTVAGWAGRGTPWHVSPSAGRFVMVGAPLTRPVHADARGAAIAIWAKAD